MTEPGVSPSARAQAAASGAAAKPSGVRVNVEQASYSYTARRQAAPIFTLEATTFQARDRELVLTGLDIELVREITGAAGQKIEFEKRSWAGVLEGLQDGSIDLTVGYRRAERDAYVRYSFPYRLETEIIMVRRGEAHDWPRRDLSSLLAAMQGRFRIGVVEGYVYGPERFDACRLASVAPGLTGRLQADLVHDPVGMGEGHLGQCEDLLRACASGRQLPMQRGDRTLGKLVEHPAEIVTTQHDPGRVVERAGR